MQRVLMGLVLTLALVAPCPSRSQTLLLNVQPPHLDGAQPDAADAINARLAADQRRSMINGSGKPAENPAGSKSLKLLSVPLSGNTPPSSFPIDVLRGKTKPP